MYRHLTELPSSPLRRRSLALILGESPKSVQLPDGVVEHADFLKVHPANPSIAAATVCAVTDGCGKAVQEAGFDVHPRDVVMTFNITLSNTCDHGPQPWLLLPPECGLSAEQSRSKPLELARLLLQARLLFLDAMGFPVKVLLPTPRIRPILHGGSAVEYRYVLYCIVFCCISLMCCIGLQLCALEIAFCLQHIQSYTFTELRLTSYY